MENQREPPQSGETVLLEWYSHRAGRILGRICPDMVAAWSWAIRLLPRGIDRESIRFSAYKGGVMAKTDREYFEELLKNEVPPVKLGNTNKSGKCGMCGTTVSNLYPCKVGQVKFMICGNCKSIMDM